jgi:putative component of toxin-antitoxin plasmid stabilization module
MSIVGGGICAPAKSRQPTSPRLSHTQPSNPSRHPSVTSPDRPVTIPESAVTIPDRPVTIGRNTQSADFKPMPAIGKGVEELRIWDESGTYRVIYTARLEDFVAVLHAFQKKTQATSPRDVELARTRWLALSKER